LAKTNAMFEVIQADLEVLESRLMRDVTADSAIVTSVGRHILESGGKRLRPALCILSARGGQNFDLERVLPIAECLELLHTASLMHDDVIDEADTRRGAITANAKWGNQIAILTGDFIFAKAFSLVATKDYDSYIISRLVNLVCDLSVGEIVQDESVYQAVTDEADYYSRIQKKTADFLEVCAEVGALIGGMSREEARRMAAYGHAIGMAFQVTDDLLDVLQTSEQIGKPVGNDIRQGIVTLPVIRAMAVSPDAAELRNIVTNPEMTDDDVQRALDIVLATDGVDVAKAKADQYLDEARQALPDSLPQEIYDSFIEVADFIGERDF